MAHGYNAMLYSSGSDNQHISLLAKTTYKHQVAPMVGNRLATTTRERCATLPHHHPTSIGRKQQQSDKIIIGDGGRRGDKKEQRKTICRLNRYRAISHYCTGDRWWSLPTKEIYQVRLEKRLYRFSNRKILFKNQSGRLTPQN